MKGPLDDEIGLGAGANRRAATREPGQFRVARMPHHHVSIVGVDALKCQHIEPALWAFRPNMSAKGKLLYTVPHVLVKVSTEIGRPPKAAIPGNHVDRTKDATLSDMVFERILTAIYECRLPPGSVINEALLAEEYAVSRGPVREAVRRLQGVQLVTREPYFKARVVNMTIESSIELFQMRAALEGYACRLAAQRMTDAQISELSLDLEGARHAYLAGGSPGTPDAGANTAGKAFDFHERIVVASGNSRIIDALCGDLYHLLRVYRKRSGAVRERKEAAYAEHWQILRALRMRDDDLAESLMRSHIARAADHLAGHLADHLAETDVGVASARG